MSVSNIVFIDGGNNLLTVAPYVPPPASHASRTETTIFDQVYGGQRRRPGMISLNVQWIPVDDRSGTYQWKGNDVSGQKVKTVTFFGTGGMRGQQQPTKAVTPPGSDYTDAYLSAFAAKPIPTRHVHRLSTAVFDNSAPIPLKPTTIPISTTSSIKTSQTRFVNVNDIQNPSSFERSTPTPSDRSSNYSPSFVAPERSTAYEPFSRTQYSSPHSQTRSTNANDLQTSSSFERSIPTPSDRSSTYSPSFAPEKSTTYESISRTQYSPPQSQTFTSNYATLVRSPVSTMTTTPIPSVDNQRTYTTFHNYSRPVISTYSPPSRSEKTCFESIYKPLPPYSFQAYPPSSGYSAFLPPLSTGLSATPYVPFSSAPITSSFSSTRSSTNERTVLPAPTSEKPLDRPETLLFQHDEDLRSPSRIEKPSPLLTPSPQSPMIREEVKVPSGPSASEESSSVTSEPIRILESTLSKYDSLINQISEVLASVSPLSSTISSMSPGKSVLDYQLSSDSSPVLPHRRLDSEPSQSSTTPKSSDTQRTRESHLIREDSYDKIVTVMSDLDRNLISPSDTQKSSSIREESDDDDIKTPAIEDYRMPSIREEENLKSNTPSLDELQYLSETKQETEPSSFSEHPTMAGAEDQKQEEIQAESTVEETKPSLVEELKTSNIDESQVPSEIKKEQEDEIKAPVIDEKEFVSTTEEEKNQTTKISITSESEILLTTEEGKKEESVTSSTTEPDSPVVNQEEKMELKTSLSALEEQKEIKTEISDISETPIVAEETQEESSISSTVQSESTAVDQEEKVELKTPLHEEEQKEIKTEASDKSETPTMAEEKTEESTISSTVQSESPVVDQEDKVELKTSLQEEEQREIKTEVSDEPEIPIVVEEKKEEPTISVMTDSEGPATHEEEKKEETTSVQLEEPSTIETSSAADSESQGIIREEKIELKTSLQEPEQTPLSTEPSTEYQTSSIIEENKEEPIILSTTDSGSPTITEEEKVEATTLSDEQVNEEIKPESLDQHPISSVVEEKKEETVTSSAINAESPVIDQQEKVDAKIVSEEQEQLKEETKTEALDEHQIPFVTDQKDEELVSSSVTDSVSPTVHEEQAKEDIKTEFSDVSQTSSVIEETKEEALTQTASFDEQSKVEIAQFIEQQTGLLASVPSDAPVTEEVKDISAIKKTSKKARKRVTWDETVIDNEDNGSSSESDTEETTAADRQSTSSESSELQSTSEKSTSSSISTELSTEDNLKTTSPTTAALEIISAEQQISPWSQTEDETAHPTPTTVEVESTPSSQQTIPFDVDESQVTHQEEGTDSRSSPDAQSISTIDSSKEDTLTVDEASTTTSDVVSHEISVDSPSPIVESTPLSSQPIIISPIETLADTISNRYISSDVYHGYLGDHQTTSEVSSCLSECHYFSLLSLGVVECGR